jgi:hypothetical protein
MGFTTEAVQRAAQALAAEIRGTIARMPKSERRIAVLRALQDGGDSADSFISAVLAAPAMLSDLDEPEHAHIRGSWAAARKPDETRRLAELEKSTEHIARGGRLILGVATKCYSSGIVDAALRSQATANAAMATGVSN